MKISIIQGDITSVAADAIVNAANSSLLCSGGIDGAINRAAGPELETACREIIDKNFPHGLPPGQAVATKAYNLKAKIIIHTVGPIYGRQDINLLMNCYRNSLKLAEENRCRTIAFPAISTGAYGVPTQKSAEIVKRVLQFFKSQVVEEILLVLYSKNDYDTYKEVFGSDRVSF